MILTPDINRLCILLGSSWILFVINPFLQKPLYLKYRLNAQKFQLSVLCRVPPLDLPRMHVAQLGFESSTVCNFFEFNYFHLIINMIQTPMLIHCTNVYFFLALQLITARLDLKACFKKRKIRYPFFPWQSLLLGTNVPNDIE